MWLSEKLTMASGRPALVVQWAEHRVSDFASICVYILLCLLMQLEAFDAFLSHSMFERQFINNQTLAEC